MTINSYFYDSVDGDRPYSAANFAAAFGVILGNGIVPTDETGAALGMAIATDNSSIQAGKAVVEGHFIEIPDSEPLTVPTGDYSGMIVLRVDFTTARDASIAIITDQIPQQDSDVYELPLYNCTVSGGVISTVSDLRVQGGAIAKPASNIPYYFYRDNGVYLQVGDYSIALTPAQPPASAKRVWIQIDN